MSSEEGDGSVVGGPGEPPEACELCDLTAARILQALNRRQVSPVEVARAQLERIEEVDPGLNAFRLVDGDRTLDEARLSEERYTHLERAGLVDGLPVAIKDGFHTRGWNTLFGSLTVEPDQDTDRQSPTVAALRRQNAIPLGKTTMPEFGWKAVTDSPLTGVSRNPWNPDLTCGGSSGGNAIALTTGMCSLAVGTDIGGSVRIPASFCGIVGLKPTQDLAPVRLETKSGLLLHSGIMARTVEDVALGLDAVGIPHPRRPAASGETARYTQSLARDVEGLRVALSPGLGLMDVEPEIEEAVLEVGRTLELLDAWVTEVDPELPDPTDLYTALYAPGLALDYLRVPEDRRESVDSGLRETAEMGRGIPATRVVEALQERRKLIAALGRLHQHFDVLLTATVPIPPFSAGLEVPEGWPDERWWSWATLTFPFNITGQPALSVPCGFTEGGLPVGAQFVGARFREDEVLRAAHAYQRACPRLNRRPPV
jgi:aspartyl-tRNA(Asn)/glutamyl-tRNA(Gln) amidotransferase subunit A